MFMKKGVLYIIQGFIGAGKSTFSRKLANEKRAVHLNPDEWVGKLYSKEEYMADWNKCFSDAVDKLWTTAKELLRGGKNVIFDMGFWLKKDRDLARQVAKECQSECVHYYLNVPDEILKQRIVADRPPQWAKIHLENFEKNKKLFQEPEMSENAIIIENY